MERGWGWRQSGEKDPAYGRAAHLSKEKPAERDLLTAGVVPVFITTVTVSADKP